MTLQPTFQRYLRMARETTWGASPAGVGYEYNADGANFSFITTSPLGTLKRVAPLHRTKGAVGKRSLDQHSPVQAAHHAEGSLDIPFVSSYGGLLLRAALGAGTSSIDTADAAVLAVTALGVSPQTINTGITNPTATIYPYLKITLDVTAPGAFGATGSIVVTGTDRLDQAQTETITFGAKTADCVVCTQKRWKTVTSFVVTGFVAGAGSGNINVDGVTYTTHIFDCADTSGSLSVEEFGDPDAGSGNAWVYNGMSLTDLTLAFNTIEEEGLLTITPNMAGKYPAAVAKTTNVITPLGPWPSWTASVTRGGSPFARLQSANIKLGPLSRLYRAAVGSQNPAGKADVGRMLEISGQVIVEDNTEYGYLNNGTVSDFGFVFTSPFMASDAAYESLTLDYDQLYFITHDAKEDDGVIVADFTAYLTEAVTTNIMCATLVNAKNGAY